MKSNILPLLAGWVVFFTTCVVLAAPADLDPLDANLIGDFEQSTAAVLATAEQPDGKIIIAGGFTSVLGVPRNNVARLNADGTLDMGFDPNPDGLVLCVAVQADGKVLLAGAFNTVRSSGGASPSARKNIARFNANGVLDAGFDPSPNNVVDCVAVQTDGKVLLGGDFSTLRPNGAAVATPRQYVARVNGDGTLDTEFDPKANSTVIGIAVQPDGKVLLGGTFTTLQPNGAPSPTERNSIARVNSDGTLDTAFDPKTNSTVVSMAVQPDGKVLLGGSFTTLQPNGAPFSVVRNRIARVNPDGTLDATFDPRANNNVFGVVVQVDGKVIFCGFFTTLQPNGATSPASRNHIARVNADGTLDTVFDPNTNYCVSSVMLQADGKVLLGGHFTTLRPNGVGAATSRNYLALIQNNPAIQTLFTPDATQTLWRRNGAAPELSRVTFELSPDGTNWTSLGPGTRIGTTADWQRTGLSLPASGLLRARGTTTGGSNSSSSGLIEQVATFTYSPPFQQWKFTHLGNLNASDLGDTDFDGLVHLAEYALKLSPTTPSLPPLAERHLYAEGERLRMFFTRDPARNDVTIEVQAADRPAGPWTTVAASTLGGVTTGPGYVGGDDTTPGLKSVEVRDTVDISPTTTSR